MAYTKNKIVCLLYTVLTLLLVLGSCTFADAWWGKGHMTVAEIARRHLTPSNLQKAELLVEILSVVGPYSKSSQFIEIGPWADDLKSMGLMTTYTWHFIDQPYNPDNVTIAHDPIDTVNVREVIPLLVSSITDKSTNYDILAHSLAYLVHFVGDIHQPLHCAELFSKDYPTGDLGGNKQTIVWNQTSGAKMLLHAFWDSICEGEQDDPPRPLSPMVHKEISAFADMLEDTYKFTDAEKQETNSTVMASESYSIAATLSYPNINDGTVLTETYKQQCKVAAETRITLAGYRLATILNTILPKVDINTIMAGIRAATSRNATVNPFANLIDPGDNDNCRCTQKSKTISSGAAAGVAIITFVVGCVVAAIIVWIFFKRAMHRKLEEQDVDAGVSLNPQRQNASSSKYMGSAME